MRRCAGLAARTLRAATRELPAAAPQPSPPALRTPAWYQTALWRPAPRGFACRTKFDAPLPKMASAPVRLAVPRCRCSHEAAGVRRVRPAGRGQLHQSRGRDRGARWRRDAPCRFSAFPLLHTAPLRAAPGGLRRRAGGGQRGGRVAQAWRRKGETRTLSRPTLAHAPLIRRRPGAFEVTADGGVLLFSRLAARRLPAADELVGAIRAGGVAAPPGAGDAAGFGGCA